MNIVCEVRSYVKYQYWVRERVESLYFTTLYFKTTLDYKTIQFDPKVPLCVLNGLYFKTTSNIRRHFLGPMGGLKIEALLYQVFTIGLLNFPCM